jgi:hypothetical protein
MPTGKLGFLGTIAAILGFRNYKELYEIANLDFWRTNSALARSDEEKRHLEMRIRELEKRQMEIDEERDNPEYKLFLAIREHRWRYINSENPWTLECAKAWHRFLSSPTGKVLDESMHNFALGRAQDAAHCGSADDMKTAKGIIIGWFTARNFAAYSDQAEQEEANGGSGVFATTSFPNEKGDGE